MSTGCFRRRSALALIVPMLSGLIAAGCGSNDNGGGGGGSSSTTSNANLAALKKIVDAHAKAPTHIGPTVPIGKPIPKGKHLVYVNCGAPACVVQAKAFKQAATVLGWRVDVINAQPTPQAVQSAMDEALRRKADGVASAGLGRSLYPRQLGRMNALHIPVMSTTGAEETGQGGITLDPIAPKRASQGTALLADKTDRKSVV